VESCKVEKELVIYPIVTRRYFVDFVDIALDAQHPPSSLDELLECLVVKSQGVDHVFGHFCGNVKGAQLKEVVSRLDEFGDANKVWLDQFLRSLRTIYARGTPETRYSQFRGADRRYYRPQLHSVRRREANGTVESVHLAFNEIIATPVKRAPPGLDALQTALQLAYRLRWELLEEYGNPESRNDLDMLKVALERMETEAEQRGLYRRSVASRDEFADSPLVEVFPLEQRDEMIRLHEAYREVRCPISNDGLLDQALQSYDLRVAQKALEKLGKINREFVVLASEKLAELIKCSW
jgi:hypothetical protein